MTNANNQLAVELYRAARQQGTMPNFVVTPGDIVQTLGIAAVGASDETLEAVLTTLHTTLPAARVHTVLREAAADWQRAHAASGLTSHNRL